MLKVQEKTDISFPSWHNVIVNLWVRTILTFIASQIFGKLSAIPTVAILSLFSAFFPLYLLDIDRKRWDKCDNSRYRSHQRTCTSTKSDDYRSRQLLKFRLIGQSSICPEKILKFQHFVNLLKYSIWMIFGRWGRHVICPRDRLDMFYFTGEFDWPTYSNCLSYGQKTDPSK